MNKEKPRPRPENQSEMMAEATRLLELLESSEEGVADLNSQIREKEAISKLDIGSWKLKRYGKPRMPGISSSHISTVLLPELRLLSKSPKDMNAGELKRYNSIEGKERRLKRHSRSLEIIQEYLEWNHADEVIPVRSEHRPRLSGDDDFNACQWHVYFLIYNKGEHHLEPNLGRALAVIENDKVVLFNTEEYNLSDYYGSYHPHIDSYNYMVSFDLRGKKSSDMRHLHIKIYCKNPDQEICLGEYTTYDKNRIQSGNIVFHRAPNATEQDVAVLSYRNDATALAEVPKEIRDFLAIKNPNYHRVREDVRTLEGLRVPVARDPSQSRKSMFLERPIPVLFVSFPISAAKNNESHDFWKECSEDMANSLKDLKVVSYVNGTGFNKHNVLKPFRELEHFKTTRFFVFFAQSSEKVSFSQIQLGWALAFCKMVILIGRKEDFSKTVWQIEDEGVKKIRVTEASVKEAWLKGSIQKKLYKMIADFNADGT